MFAKSVPWWCGVDVTNENGLVRRGMIRGKARDGLFVDFDYPGHNNDFVPVDRCEDHYAPFYRISDAVEALYQSALDQPWRWYPAKLLTGSAGRFAFVEIHTDERVVEKVVPADTVRIVGLVHSGHYGRQILQRYFEYDFELPNSGDLGKLTSGLIEKFGEDGFVMVWSRETSTIGMKLEGGRLFYSSQSQMPLWVEDTEAILQRIAEKYLSSQAASPATMADDAVDPDSMDIDQFDLMDDPITAQLSLDVMDEIFSFLTAIQQVACRKVCQLWNSVLTSVPSTFRVEIDISTIGYSKLATILHKTVTESTKVLVLSGGSDMQQFSTIQRLHTVKTMLKAMNLRVQFVVLSRARVESDDLLDSWYSADCDGLYHCKWRDACSTLISNDVAVLLPFATEAFLVIKKYVLDVKVDVGVERALEKWCPVVSGPEMGLGLLEEKLCGIWDLNQRDDRFYLWTLLTKYRPADERFHPYDLDNFPPAGTLGVPALASLRKLTVWALTGH